MPTAPAPLTTTPADTILVSRTLAALVATVGSLTLLYYLAAYVRGVLSGPYGRGWWFLGVGVAAGAVYGLASLLAVAMEAAAVRAFAEGATLFFILFLALGIRALYFYGRDRGPASRVLPAWADLLVVAGFVVAWWAGFVLGRAGLVALVVSVGWVIASAWAVLYAVMTVRTHEGTSIAALTRHLLPAVVSFALIALAGVVGRYLPRFAAVADAGWIVGTAVVGTFLFTTAVALRQQGGEAERLYDPTTWHG